MCGLFGKKKRKQQNNLPVQEKEYTCLFCKGKFKASEIIFGRTLGYPDPEFRDEVFNNQLNNYQAMTYVDQNGKAYGLVPISRRMIDMETCHVAKRETNGLPLIVTGTLEKSQSKQSTAGDNLGFSEGVAQTSAAGVNEDEITITTSERLCPKCHFTLPEGFADYPVVQIGLLGGSRSGKTTYMAVLTEYMLNKMGMLNSGLEMARVELLPECQKYQEALYLSQRNPLGAKATPIVGEIKDQMVMPIVLEVRPVDESYSPFFVVLQDIPGEYLLQSNQSHLLSSNIPKSTELILLVDINHFIETSQQEDASEFGDYCKQNVNELFTNISTLGHTIPKNQLNSVQCTLTKLDFWISGEPDRLENAIFANNCDDAHRNGINVNRLGLVHDQINSLLDGIGGEDQSGLLDNLIKSMNLEGTNIHKAYTAVASRIVPGHESQVREKGADYQSSLNVLEPLMNIFEWKHLLPVKEEETETDEE